MARDSSGKMSIPYPDFVAGTPIASSKIDANFSDIADEITNTIAADGQTVITADIPMNLKKFTGLTAGAAATDSVTLGQVQGQAYLWGGTAGGEGGNPENALTLSPSPAITAYVAGQTFRFIAGASDNTGAATVNISGLGAKAIRNNGAALAAGDIKAGQLYEIVYDGAQFQLTWRAAPSEFIKTLIDDADAAAARFTLGLAIGTDVQSYDADLAAIAGLTSATDKLAYYTGAATAALTDLTSQARQLLDDTSFTAMRTTLGLAIGTNVNEYLTTMSQAEAEAGTATTRRIVTAQRMKQAIDALAGVGGAKVTTFTSSGTFTPDSAAALTHIYLWGGGGGGGASGNDASGGGGGGGGGFAAATYASARIGSGTISVTVGSGGAGAPGAGNGNNGGGSSFGSFLSASGGSGGSQGGSGGSGGTGSIDTAALASQTESGGSGGNQFGSGNSPADGYAGAGGGGRQGGGGGTSAMGGNGGGESGAGSVPGGGGGGGEPFGGDGGAGKVIVIEILS